MKKLRETLLSSEPNKVVGTLFLLLFIAFCMYVLCKVIDARTGSTCTQVEASLTK